VLLLRASRGAADRSRPTTNFARKLKVNIPLASAAMDTVTEIAPGHRHRAAGRHRDGAPQHAHRPAGRGSRPGEALGNGMKFDPVTISSGYHAAAGAGDHDEIQDSGLPVTRGMRLTGILTTATCDLKRIFATGELVMTKENLVTVPVGTTLEEASASCKSTRIEKLRRRRSGLQI